MTLIPSGQNSLRKQYKTKIHYKAKVKKKKKKKTSKINVKRPEKKTSRCMYTTCFAESSFSMKLLCTVLL